MEKKGKVKQIYIYTLFIPIVYTIKYLTPLVNNNLRYNWTIQYRDVYHTTWLLNIYPL